MPIPEEGQAQTPRVGDVWVLSSDGRDVGVVVVSAVRDTHVLAWPVTNESRVASFPAFKFGVEEDATFVAWPEAEFGLVNAGLDRRIGRALTADQTKAVFRSMHSGRVAEGVDYCEEKTDSEANLALGAVCAEAWRLGDLALLSAGGGVVLDSAVLEENGVDSERLEGVVSVEPAIASRLWAGEAVPTDQQLAKILTLFPQGTSSEDVLVPMSGDEARVVSSPEFKSAIKELAASNGVAESRVRMQLWEDSLSIAARDSDKGSLQAGRRRVRIALAGLQENPAF